MAKVTPTTKRPAPAPTAGVPAIVKPQVSLPATVGDMPDWMKGEQVTGTETLGRYIVPPRVKIIQPLTRAPLIEQFDPGAAIIVPQAVLIADVARADNGRPQRMGTPFFATPVLFYPEWVAWNPLETRGSLPAVRGRTMDPNSQLAAKARDSALWAEPCPEMPEKNIRYCEHLNFILVLYGIEAVGMTPVVVSFSRGEHRTGTNFAALIKMRKASIFGGVYQFTAGWRENVKGQWFGFDVGNPSAESSVSPWVQDHELFKALEALHNQYSEAYTAGLVQADYDDGSDDTPVDAAPGEF